MKPKQSQKKSQKQYQHFKKTVMAIEQALQNGDMTTVERLCNEGLRQHPNQPVLLCGLSKYHGASGHRDEALRISEQALAHGGLGIKTVVAHHVNLLLGERQHEEAIECVDKALEKLPAGDQADIENLKARALTRANRRAEALPIFERLVSQKPTPGVLNDYAFCLYDLGRQEAGFMQLRLATALDPKNLVLRSNTLLHAHYLPEMDQAELLGLHKEWFESCAAQYGQHRSFQRRPMEGRALRVGFISNGFRAHPAGWLSFGSLRVLAHYFDTEVYLYSTHPPSKKDQLVPQMKAFADQWLSVHGWSTQALHQRLLDDELDILVDMAGHSEYSAIPVVAARAAPVQVKWIGGLFNTSAVPNMDYLLSDWTETPEGAEAYYTEALVRLPGGYVTYTPPFYLPQVNELPALENGQVTFGCFNNAYKINPRIASVWAEILRRVPGSRLLLKDRRYADPAVRKNFMQMFTDAGADPERIVMETESPHGELLASYHRMDIALDPWPYSGGLSTIEALYMGVPVLTYPGPTFAGRHAASHVKNAGLDEWVADSFEDYVDKAVAWGQNIDALASLRQILREQCRNSLLGNHVQFAANLDHLFRIMFGQWEKGAAPGPINFKNPVEISDEVIERLKSQVSPGEKEEESRQKEAASQHPKPELTEEQILEHMPQEEQQALNSAIRESRIFMEYGAGGSTLLAMKEKINKLITVESDPGFMDRMDEIIKKYESPKIERMTHRIDIGAVGDWSYPLNRQKITSWHEYAQKPWEQILDSGEYPDLILIDGRFRVACFMACYLFAKPGTKILFDDYANRPQYHVCENFLPVSKLAGRMALFEKNDADINQQAILELSKYNLIPQ
mgnify:CR=1 FL=1